MKIFAVYLRLTLTSKPEWLDDFRSKYSSTSISHITLVQPRYVNEDRVQVLKDKIADVLNKEKFDTKDRKLTFLKTELEKDDNNEEYILMSFIKENRSILNLQKNLVEALKDFGNYCHETTREYESNFRPHLTIANQIDLGSKDKTLQLVSQDNKLEGNTTDLVLAIVNEQTTSESENPNNWITFNI